MLFTNWSTAVFVIVVVFVMVALTGRVEASISIYDDKNQTVATIDDASAYFGPAIPEEGFLGYVAQAKPIGACSPIERPPNVSYVDARQWIALVQRTPSATGNCSFDLKVYYAQQAGFSAVIVFNSESDNLIKMSSSGRFNIKIPSVFVGHSSGVDLANYYTYVNKTYVIINNEDNDFNYLMIPFIVVVSICFLIAIALFVVKFAIHCHKMRKNRFPKSALKKIPTKKYQKTDKYDTCPICLNEYEEGVKMRILPCEHAYHVECIDKWLLRNNRVCPVCKRKVIPGGPDSDSEESGDNHPSSSNVTNSEALNNIENEANEDEDTNESSNLLVRTVRRSSASNNNNNSSTLLLNEEIESLGAVNTLAGANSSLNNQLISTVSSDRLTVNNERLKASSKYGSINSINSLSQMNNNNNNNEKTSSARRVTLDDNQIDYDDNNDEIVTQSKSKKKTKKHLVPRKQATKKVYDSKRLDSAARNYVDDDDDDDDDEFILSENKRDRSKLIASKGNETMTTITTTTRDSPLDYFTPHSATSEASASSFTISSTNKDEVNLANFKIKKSKSSNTASAAADSSKKLFTKKKKQPQTQQQKSESTNPVETSVGNRQHQKSTTPEVSSSIGTIVNDKPLDIELNSTQKAAAPSPDPEFASIVEDSTMEKLNLNVANENYAYEKDYDDKN